MPSKAGSEIYSGSVDQALAHARNLLAHNPQQTTEQITEILRIDPDNADALRLLGRAHRSLGNDAAASQAELAAIRASTHDPELVEAALALVENDLAVAERILRPRLKQNPFDVAAIRMMAELAGRIGRHGDAENLLRRALELAPDFTAARSNLALVLHRQGKSAEAIAELEYLLGDDPTHAGHRNLKAAALGRIGNFEEALSLYEDVLQLHPDQPLLWMSYGHVLKTVGRQQDSINAYRRATAIKPELGEVWWSLANLKTFQFSTADVTAMEAALKRDNLGEEDRFHLHFALGKAYESADTVQQSFDHYAKGNALRREHLDYDPAIITGHVDAAITLFLPEFFAAHIGQGCPAPDPIFIVGMPRSGSTLLEQILSSHALIEGTMELPDLPRLAKKLVGKGGGYAQGLARLDAEQAALLGAEYLETTRIQRKTNKPYFIDKLPNNWMHIGLIQRILPNAKIIDARRHPLGCCFSNFKQHFAQGQEFSYSLDDMGQYYRDYVRLFAHFDTVLPGRAHRVLYESMVADSETEVRAVLDYIGVDFDPACLRFWENDRAVRTASSEQVRRPINRDGIDGWQMFEPWLGSLKRALGPVLDDYPA